MTAQNLSQRVLAAESDEPIWESPCSGATPTTSEVLHRTRVPQPLQADLEDALIAIVRSPVRSGETHLAAGERREREAEVLIAGLDAAQAHHLGRRLDIARPDDPIVVAFCRLTTERRVRLRQFIADARRRSAMRPR